MKILETAKKIREYFSPLGISDDKHSLKYTVYRVTLPVEHYYLDLDKIILDVTICEQLKEDSYYPPYECGANEDRNKWWASLILKKNSDTSKWSVEHKSFDELENFIQNDILKLISCMVHMRRLGIRLTGCMNEQV